MTAPSPEAQARGRIGAHVRWSREPDRVAALAPALAGFMDRFERQVDPDGTLPPSERAIRAEHARKAYMTQLSLKAAKARKAKAARGAR
jgi:hypothetical protein